MLNKSNEPTPAGSGGATREELEAELAELRRRVRRLDELETRRCQVEDKLRESEERYRQLFTQMGAGFALHEMILDAAGRPVDYRFLDVNPAFERLTGLRREDLVDRTVLEVLPGTEAEWIERYGRVALTGEPVSFESYSGALGRHYEVHAFAPRGGRFAVTFTDVTARKEGEHRLRQSERLLRELAESLHSTVWVRGTDRMLYVSPNVQRMFGVSVREALADPKSFLRHVHPEERERVAAACDAAAREERGGVDIQCRVRHPDGQLRWVWIRTYAVFGDADGQRIVGVADDVTERHEREERFRGLVEHSAAGYFRLDADCVLREANQALAAMHGYPAPEDLVGRRLEELLMPEEASRVSAMVERALAGEGVPNAAAGRHLLADGSVGTYTVSSMPVRREGRIVGLEGFVIDTSELTRTREALERSEDLFRHLVDNVSDVFWVRSEQGLEYVSPAFERLWGLPARQAVEDQSTFSRHVHPEDRERVAAGVSAMFAEGAGSTAIEYRIVRPDGVERWLRARMLPMGEVAGRRVVGITEDITIRKRVEERLRASLAEKETLLREVHHRVKNNLQVVVSLLQLQGEQIGDPDGRELLRESQNRVRAMALVHEKLYRSGTLSRVDLGGYAETLARHLHVMSGPLTRRVRLDLKIEPLDISIDQAVPCGLVLNELLTNVFKHAFPGEHGGHVSLSVSRADGDVVLAVQDDGVGLPEESPAGAGLGLTLVESLARQLRGRLTLCSAGGTRAELRFPFDAGRSGSGGGR